MRLQTLLGWTMQNSAKNESSKTIDLLSTFIYKCISLGDWKVGKTSMLKRFCDGTFSETYIPNIGCDFLTKMIKFEKANVKLVIWDIGGQRLPLNYRKRFYKGAKGVLLVFDVTRPESLPSLKEWREEALKVCGEIPFIVCGNKIDLESKINETEAKNFAEEINSPLLFTSAKTGENIEEAYTLLAQRIHTKK